MAGKEIKALKENDEKEKSELVTQVQYLDLSVVFVARAGEGSVF